MTSIHKKDDKEITKKFTEAIRFEHWIRFHCIREKEGSEDVYIDIPAPLLLQCQQEVPHLSLLFFALQDSLITLESTRAHVFAFIQHEFEMSTEELAQCIENITHDKDFLRYLDVFYGFVQTEADAEEEVLKDLETKMSQEEITHFIATAPIPSFLTWTQKFCDWAASHDYKI